MILNNSTLSTTIAILVFCLTSKPGCLITNQSSIIHFHMELSAVGGEVEVTWNFLTDYTNEALRKYFPCAHQMPKLLTKDKVKRNVHNVILWRKRRNDSVVKVDWVES